jgi:hypothetical protein
MRIVAQTWDRLAEDIERLLSTEGRSDRSRIRPIPGPSQVGIDVAVVGSQPLAPAVVEPDRQGVLPT